MRALRLTDLLQLLRDRVAVYYLTKEVTRAKAQQYDLLCENIIGLRRAIETQQRAADELQLQLSARDAHIATLRAEYSALEARNASAQFASARDERIGLFRRMQAIVTHLPTLRAAVEAGADVTAQDVLDLLRPLDQVLLDLGFEQIGQAGAETRFDPKLHRAVGSGAQTARPDDRVRVRYVGYQYAGEVISKAEVTLISYAESVST